MASEMSVYPGKWPLVKLGSVADLTLSSVDKKTKLGEEPVQLCNYMDVYANRHIQPHLPFMVATATKREKERCTLRSGDVVITKDSEQHDDIGVPALVRNGVDGVVCGYHLAILRPRRGSILGPYLLHALQTADARHQFSSYANGVTRFALRRDDILRVEVRLPPVPRQRAIASFLSALDDKADLNVRMAATLDEAVIALFTSLYSGAAASGPVKALAEVSSTTRGRSYRSSELVDDSDTAMVTLKSFKRGGGYRPDGLKPFRGPYKVEQVVRAGDVVVACTDVTQDADVVGRSALVQASPRFDTLVASLDVLILRPRGDLVSSAFLYGLTSSHGFVSHAKSHATGTTVLHMASGAVPSFEFSCPPRERMAAFDRVAEPALSQCGELLQEADRLAGLRDTLLPKLISGEIRIPDAEKIVEAAT